MIKERNRAGISVSYHQTSDQEGMARFRSSECGGDLPIGRAAGGIRAFLALLAAVTFIFCQALPLRAQDQSPRIPIVSKLKSGKRQQAFSGTIQSLDMKQRILNVNSLHGHDTAIFPFKKNVRIENLNGNRMDVAKLTPGMSILIYFDQRSGERKIRNIIVLSSGKKQAKGKPAPSS